MPQVAVGNLSPEVDERGLFRLSFYHHAEQCGDTLDIFRFEPAIFCHALSSVLIISLNNLKCFYTITISRSIFLKSQRNKNAAPGEPRTARCVMIWTGR